MVCFWVVAITQVDVDALDYVSAISAQRTTVVHIESVVLLVPARRQLGGLAVLLAKAHHSKPKELRWIILTLLTLFLLQADVWRWKIFFSVY